VDQQVLKQAGWSTKDGFRNDLLRRTRVGQPTSFVRPFGLI
jgi:hypothetical protein